MCAEGFMFLLSSRYGREKRKDLNNSSFQKLAWKLSLVASKLYHRGSYERCVTVCDGKLCESQFQQSENIVKIWKHVKTSQNKLICPPLTEYAKAEQKRSITSNQWTRLVRSNLYFVFSKLSRVFRLCLVAFVFSAFLPHQQIITLSDCWSDYIGVKKSDIDDYPLHNLMALGS